MSKTRRSSLNLKPLESGYESRGHLYCLRPDKDSGIKSRLLARGLHSVTSLPRALLAISITEHSIQY
ncbi:hypothetical protein D5086_028711 [Populus alba]|uniref:Uncharacterized protein n=1 Tax=Populus alba TaxID=43335 RepID=A0ACC4AS99_POPAL